MTHRNVWEYNYSVLDVEKSKEWQQKMDDLGNSGWELVSVVPIIAGSVSTAKNFSVGGSTETRGFIAWFKRLADGNSE